MGQGDRGGNPGTVGLGSLRGAREEGEREGGGIPKGVGGGRNRNKNVTMGNILQ